MSDYQRTKLVAFTAIIALVGLVTIIISVRSDFPELLFYSIVMILIGFDVCLLNFGRLL